VRIVAHNAQEIAGNYAAADAALFDGLDHTNALAGIRDLLTDNEFHTPFLQKTTVEKIGKTTIAASLVGWANRCQIFCSIAYKRGRG
jgi:hypothetical protein